MTVKEVYEKAQCVESSIAYLNQLGDLIKESDPKLYERQISVINQASIYLEEYAERLYSTGSYL